MPVPFNEKCRVCGAAITCWGWSADEEYVESDEYACTGSFCDFADSNGCFGHYCVGCFDKHTCGAFKKEPA